MDWIRVLSPVHPPQSDHCLIAYGSGDPDAFATVPGVTPAIMTALSDGVKEGYADSFAWVWYSMIPFFAVSLLASLWLDPTKPWATKEVVTMVEKFSHSHNHEDTDNS
jgi:hypothetical protein